MILLRQKWFLLRHFLAHPFPIDLFYTKIITFTTNPILEIIIKPFALFVALLFAAIVVSGEDYLLLLGTVELGLAGLVSARSIDSFDSKMLLIEGLLVDWRLKCCYLYGLGLVLGLLESHVLNVLVDLVTLQIDCHLLVVFDLELQYLSVCISLPLRICTLQSPY